MAQELAQYLAITPIALARAVLAVLISLLLAAAWFDVRQQRIPNALVVPGALMAVLLHVATPAGDGFLAYFPGGLGVWGALSGLVFGLLALLPLYALRGMGAGDVKLLAMVGAFLGPRDFAGALIATLLAGGVLAAALALQRRALGRVLQNLKLVLWNGMLKLSGAGAALPEFGVTTTVALPFGVAIATGSMAYVIFRALRLGLV